ncbi:MAG: type II toxin-antitoxin system VapC family toxin [Chloroflexi bacterium]|nr:type II toxin-antitoxin system VapC family toxin [Chloroflexota bacterium]
MTVFVDTAVIMYAGGGQHPMRAPCTRIMDAIDSGGLEAVISAEVVQEIVHRFLSIRQPDVAVAMASVALSLFAPVLPITHALMRRVPDLAKRYPGLDARDLVHIATCIHEGITEIISPDRGFDRVRELRRIAPEDFEAPS